MKYNVDSIRDMTKYSNLRAQSAGGLETMRLSYDVKMFRAQRNFYIAGFTVFLWLWVGSWNSWCLLFPYGYPFPKLLLDRPFLCLHWQHMSWNNSLMFSALKTLNCFCLLFKVGKNNSGMVFWTWYLFCEFVLLRVFLRLFFVGAVGLGSWHYQI